MYGSLLGLSRICDGWRCLLAAIKAQGSVALAQEANALQSVERFGQIEGFAMLDGDYSVVREEIGNTDFLQHAGIVRCGCIWWIDKDVIVKGVGRFYFGFQSFKAE